MLGAITNIRYVFSRTRRSNYGPRPNTSLIPHTASERMVGTERMAERNPCRHPCRSWRRKRMRVIVLMGIRLFFIFFYAEGHFRLYICEFILNYFSIYFMLTEGTIRAVRSKEGLGFKNLRSQIVKRNLRGS
jgi:hypothetical protein